MNIVLSPHFDDAVFSLGGFIHQHSRDTKIITVFAGKPEKPRKSFWDMRCGFKNSDHAIEMRIQENKNAVVSLGVPEEHIINLPFIDSQYIKKNQRAAIVKALVPLLQSENINIYIPFCGTHTDHALVRDIVLEHISEKVYLYQDLPYFKNEQVSAYKAEIIQLSKEDVEKKIQAAKLYTSQFKARFFGLRALFKNKIFLSPQETVYYR